MWLGGRANGIQDLFAKNLHAENVHANHGFFNTLTASSTITAGQELCVGLTCVTEGELQELLNLRSLLNGSVLGASTHAESEAAAGTPGSGVDVRAPAATPAGGTSGAPIIISNGGNPATATTTPTNDPPEEASEAQAEPEVATERENDQPAVEEAPAPEPEPAEEPIPEPANDNTEPSELPVAATGAH